MSWRLRVAEHVTRMVARRAFGFDEQTVLDQLYPPPQKVAVIVPANSARDADTPGRSTTGREAPSDNHAD